MKNIHILFYFSIFIALNSACSKLLDIVPNDQLNIEPNSIQHYEELLNNNSFGKSYCFLADLMSDDLQVDNDLYKKILNTHFGNIYLWEKDVWKLTEQDDVYKKAYSNILQLNILLSEIGNVSDGSEEKKNILRAQAKINRAFIYLQLVNLYGAAYSPLTSEYDLSVPLILTPLYTKGASRNSVAEVYKQILNDLDDAIKTKSLPNFGIDVLHPGRMAAFALKARSYLLMSDYENALIATDSVLSKKKTVLDYNTFKFINSRNPSSGIVNKPYRLIEFQAKQDELIFAKEGGHIDFIQSYQQNVAISDDLSKLFSSEDLRFIYNFYENNDHYYFFLYNNNSLFYDNSISVPEIMLIKAECLARASKFNEAINLVNELRKYRFAPDKYVTFPENSTNTLRIVLEERRRELFMRGGLRLFDLKRLNNEAEFKKDIYRYLNNSIVAVLPANSPRYLFPFSSDVLLSNPNINQNER